MKLLFILIISVLMMYPNRGFAQIIDENNLILIEGKLTSNYGRRMHPISKMVKVHHGIDIKTSSISLRSPVSGTIKSARWETGYGNVIRLVLPNDDEIMFAHLKSFNVDKFDIITEGDVLGVIGNTGYTTGVHLHIEYKINDKRVNPLSIIRLVAPD